VDKSTRSLLTPDELTLVKRSSASSMSRLDEEELVALHDRVRRARNKYAKLHRRQAAAQVAKDASRAVAGKKNQGTARKAEVFETALADVSHQLAKVATERAAELKAERLAAAAAVRGSKKRASGSRGKGSGKVGKKTSRVRAASHITDRRAASTRSQGKRKQAKADSKR
jgi:hypothetical protein